ncbi:class I SAM-dependent methyltransferase [Desulfosporosinus youngiae]|uniref:Methylase involved in ubiquinone/menaquinone biosynthesis n=1 Tax=Desulfosporosinus youngiae DSM 17734 TaxID=768710 RepID=H5Y643_9FIRM|nr:class I SAM-dependent methyltransferase [Desulfosporosinus youngiae]EHQ91053.1 methylase involved in ubiquinone/menaquinone biosynthesis [Desulfosporosinus youngiae DSM 17734]
MAYLEAIKDYWTTQVAGFAEINLDELTSDKYELWLSVLEENLPAEKGLAVLDVGCGTGFFSIVMSKLGHRVTAVDYNEGMLEQAGKNAQAFGVGGTIDFLKMDAQKLEFADQVFDVILSRDITWVLENPAQAYGEWLRVLKPKGRFLNFDGNWFLHLHDEKAKGAYERGLEKVMARGFEVKESDHNEEFETIVRSLPLSKERRPAWDIGVLTDLGCEKIMIKPKLPGKIHDAYYECLYAEIPTFMVAAIKE